MMFTCDHCGKEFKRKFNLSRHVKTKHNTLENGTKDVMDTNENDVGRNEEEEEEGHDKHDYFDQRILPATEAIKFKNNIQNEHHLRTKHDILNSGVKDIDINENDISENEEDIDKKDYFDRRVLAAGASKFDSNNSFEAKLLQLLQSALHILMMKELQNVDTQEVQLKRSFRSEDELNSSKKDSIKRLKYDGNITELENDGNTTESENDDYNCKHSKCAEIRYWHDPNKLVDELKELTSTSQIGQQIATIMQSLHNSDGEQRNKLIRALSKLKKTSIGQQIFSIIHELVKAEIIEQNDYINDEEKDSNSTIDNEEILYN